MAVGCPRGLVLVALAGVLAALPARATTLEVTSTTLVQGRAQPRDGEERTVLPLIELVNLEARQISNPLVDNLALHLSAWGRINPVEGNGQLGNGADLDLAYASGDLFSRRLSVKLGRFFVQGGAARLTQLDGGAVDMRVVRGLGISAYGGLPVVPRFAAGRGDAVVGGRVYYRASVDAEVGASIEQLWDNGYTARQVAGLDGRYVLKGVTVGALGMWSIIDQRLAEADVSASWQPVDALQASLEVRRTAPDLFLPRTSILSVFAADTHDEAGGSLFFRPCRCLSFFGEYHYLRYGAEGGLKGIGFDAQSGHQASVKATWYARFGLTVGLQARFLTAPYNGYYEGRLFGTWRATRQLTAVVDLDAYRFLNPINGHSESYVGSLSLTYTLRPGWMAALTGLASVTPYFESRFEGVAKLVYNFSTRAREVQP